MHFPRVRVIIVAVLLLPFFLCSSSVKAAEATKPKTELQKQLDEAVKLKNKKQFIQAQSLLRQAIQLFPQDPFLSQAIKELESINLFVINNNVPTPETVFHIVKQGETLDSIARQYQTTVEIIKRRNRMTKDIIQTGARLSVWRGPLRIVIDKSDNVLTLLRENRIIKRYRISTGKQSTTTPEGEFTITSKLMHPVWFHRGVIVPPGTPENFLGTRWMGFDKPKYGIHGTIEPERIGQSVSSGCVRMRNEDVDELYEYIPYGTKVLIQD